MHAIRILLLCAFGAAPAAAQATLAVPGSYSTIQAAINAAQTGDTVLVAAGTYNENIDFLGKAITVRGDTMPGQTVIDAQGSGSVVKFITGETSSSVLEHVTLAHGQGAAGGAAFNQGWPGQGGGIHCANTYPTIRHCVITLCTGGPGGWGISMFTGSAGGDGGAGGIQCEEAFPTIEDCRFFQNNGGVGGEGSHIGGRGGAGAVGARGLQGSPQMTRCFFFANDGGQGWAGSALAGPGGAGCVETEASVSIRYSRFCFNTGGDGLWGGVDGGRGGPGVLHGYGLVQNCILIDNSGAPGGPGGMFGIDGIGGAGAVQSDGNVFLVHCTLTRNGGGAGPGGANGGAGAVQALNGGQVHLDSSIVWGNLSAAGATGEIQAAGGGSLWVTTSNIAGGVFPGTGNISAPPQWVAPLVDDFRLLGTSPCRDAGTLAHASGLPTDFDGDPRVVSGTPDIGADEFCLVGTGDDLVLETLINGVGPGASCTKSAGGGDALTIEITSPGGTLAGSPVTLAARLWTSSPPAPPSFLGIAGIHLDLAAVVIASHAALPAGGWISVYALPPGLAGLTGRLQAVVSSPSAMNGIYAATSAHDIVLN